MATVTFKGEPVTTKGELPAKGSKAPEFKLAATDLSGKGLTDFAGKKKVLNIVPSLDTPVCFASARRFNETIGELDDTVLLNISADLPFAASRIIEEQGLDQVEALSTFRDNNFGKAYGVEITDGPMQGLMSRAVVVVDANDRVTYVQQVGEIGDEPDYDAALGAVVKS